VNNEILENRMCPVESRTTIPEQLSHPVVLRTEKLLALSTEDHIKRILPKRGVFFHVYVSREQKGRALRIFNALLLVLEEQGCKFSWPEEENSILSLMIDGETLTFGICEIFNAKPHVLTRAEEKKPHPLAPRWDYQLTGRLRLFVGKIPYASEGRKTWSDGRYQRLENFLESFVLGLRVAAATTKKNRLKREEEERRREEERKQEEEEEKVASEQERKARFIGGLMRDWQQSRSLRAFAKALREAADQLKLSDQEKNDLQHVVGWTCDYAESLDPISNLPDCVEEFVHPERKYESLEEEE
jgi:hypothetical protein